MNDDLTAEADIIKSTNSSKGDGSAGALQSTRKSRVSARNLAAYQTTMQQFLTMQQRIMTAYLSGSAHPVQEHSAPVPATADVFAVPGQVGGMQPAEAEKASEPDRGAAVPRFLVEPTPEDMSHVRLEPVREAVYLLADDNSELGKQTAELLQAEGGIPVFLDEATCADKQKLEEALTRIRDQHGAVAGLVHLFPYSEIALGADTGLEEWRQHTRRNELRLYQLLQQLTADLLPEAVVVGVSGLGGFYGRSGMDQNGLLAQGGHPGLLKSVNDEWDAVRFKSIDLDPQLTAVANARSVLGELRLPGGRVEVGYPGGQRYVFRSVETPLDHSSVPRLQPDKDWVVLATGGARGITAEILMGLAEFGPKLVLIGRTPEPQAEAAELAELQSTSELRKYLLQKAVAQGTTPRPVEIEREISEIQRDREIRANLRELRAAGAEVDYRDCDVREEQPVTALMKDIYARYGRLDGVIHGAGIIEDKLLLDKSMTSAERVFDTKVDSLYLLAKHVQPESLQFFALFSSVAGRYGNTGQADYAMANELINRLASQLHSQWKSKVKVSAINWGPWDATRFGDGMVTPEAQRKFAAMGVELVSPEGGRQFFKNEIMYGPVSSVEVVAGEGPWESREQERGALLATAETGDTQSAFPLLVNAERSTGPRGEIIFTATIDVTEHRYLSEHLLDDVPVMPAAVSLELIAEAAASAWPDWIVTEIRNLRVFNGIKLDAGKIALEIAAQASSHGDASGFDATVTIQQVAGKGAPFYRAAVRLCSELPPAEPFHSPAISSAQVDVGKAYRDWLFHGPLLQTITSIPGMEHRGALANLNSTSPGDWLQSASSSDAWLFDPGLIDSGPQMAIIWAYVHRNASALPSRFGAVRRYGAGPLGRCTMHFLTSPDMSDEQVMADVAFVDESGKLRLLMEGMECTCSAALTRLGGGWKGGFLHDGA